MYQGYKKGESVCILKRDTIMEEYTIIPAKVEKRGKYLTVSYGTDSQVVFKQDDICSDIFGNIFRIFHTQSEASKYLKEMETSNTMKSKIEKVLKSKCTFQELEAIYLYLEERYPKEMRF